MLRNILVGLDGSPFSAAAIEFGIQWAQRFDAMLVGLAIIDEPTIHQSEAVPLGGSAYKVDRDKKRLTDARRKVEQFLERFALRCAEAGVACKELEDVGLPAKEIMIEAQRYDLVLLGQQTFFHFETQEHSDETLQNVVKYSPRPVVVVPENPRKGASVLVAYDSNIQAARTLQAFQDMGLAASQTVHIVSVHADQLEAARRADRAVEYLRSHEITAQAHAFASSEAPAEIILKQVKVLDAGLLVMGAYGRPSLTEFFFGSTTRTVLAESCVPLFLYH